jgi:hypothetical protein
MVMDKKLKQEVTALLSKLRTQSMKGHARHVPPYVVKLCCDECGESMEERFETPAAAVECTEVWNRWHRREGHARMIPILPRKLRKGEKLAEQPSLLDLAP